MLSQRQRRTWALAEPSKLRGFSVYVRPRSSTTIQLSTCGMLWISTIAMNSRQVLLVGELEP